MGDFYRGGAHLQDMTGYEDKLDSTGILKVEEGAGYKFCGWSPRCLQALNNIKFAVFFISLANCVQNAANGLLGVSISTLEKRFSFSSFMSSIIASSYEFGQVPAVIFIMIYGHRINRPLFFGLGMLSVGVGCFLFFLPQFLLSPYIPSFFESGSDKVDLCLANKSEHDIEECLPTDNLSSYLPIFAIGRFLIGMGATPILTAGITYINDGATKEDFALYSGIYNAMSIVGPGIGVLLSSLLLTVFVDFYRVDVQSLGLEDGDPRWVGNWWLGYVCLCVFAVISAIPLFGYPNNLPEAQQIRLYESKDTKKDIPLHKNVLRLLGNRSFCLTCLFSICEMFIIIGFNSFGPKLFENFLNVPPQISGMVFGLVLLPSGMVGTILGGVIIQKFQLTCKKIIRVQTVLSILALLLLPSILFTCGSVQFAGANYPHGVSNITSLQDTCNEPCSCDGAKFQPICDANGIQHFSPCHAGCQSKVYSEEFKTYELYNCSCVSNHQSSVPDAYNQPCEINSCRKAILFLLCFSIVVCLMFICFTMNLSVMLRVTRFSQATAAVSIQVLVTKLLGTIPAPVMFGMAIDMGCAMWETSPCNPEESKCVFFFTDQLSKNILLICMIPKIMGCIVLIILNFVYKSKGRNEHLSSAGSMLAEGSPISSTS